MASESGRHALPFQPSQNGLIVVDFVPIHHHQACSPQRATLSVRLGLQQLHIMAQAAIAAPSNVPYVHTHNQRSRHASKHRFFIVELSQALFDFVIQLLPTAEEMAVKEDVRKLLERLIRTIEPDSRLLSFGSTANGFSLRNSGLSCSSLIHTQH